jgi:glycosyltransferase involved in cell wall biosynthesis
MAVRVVYIVSDIEQALAFEWIARAHNRSRIALSFILLQSHSRITLLEEKIASYEVPVIRMEIGQGKKGYLAVLKLATELKKMKAEVVHCHMRRANFIGLSAARIAGVKSRIYTRHYSTQNHRYHPHAVRTDRWLNKLATRIVAPSETVVHALCTLEGTDPQKVKMIPHGFDLTYFSQTSANRSADMKKKLGIEKNRPVVGVIARYLELKGLQFAIPAFREFRQAEAPDAVLVLANAKGPFEKEIKELLKTLPKEAYREVPFETDLAALYHCLDFFIHVPISADIEAFGQVYVEALAAGIPSVFTLSGIAKSFIRHEQNAMVADYKSAVSISNALSILHNNPDLQKRLIERGKEDVAPFALEPFIQQITAIYE